MDDQLILGNLFSLYRAIADSYSGTDIHSCQGFDIISTPGSVWPNIAYDLKEADLSDEWMEEISSQMEVRGLHPFVIDAHGDVAFARFRKNKFMPIDRWTGMYLSLADAPTPGSPVAGISVKEISTGEFNEWSGIVSQTLFAGKQLEPRIFSSLPAEKATMVGIFCNQTMAGTAMIYFDEKNITGIYMVCVMEKFRRMGLGQSLMGYCLELIRGRKSEVCVLQATSEGIPLYRSLGFKECSTYYLYRKIR